jgi:transcription elongation factor Elf1
LFWCAIRLAGIAVFASCDDVFPASSSALCTRENVVVCSLGDGELNSAVLATELVSSIDVYSREFDRLLVTTECLEKTYDSRHLDQVSRVLNVLIVGFQNLNLTHEQECYSPLPADYFYRFEALTKN